MRKTSYYFLSFFYFDFDTLESLKYDISKIVFLLEK